MHARSVLVLGQPHPRRLLRRLLTAATAVLAAGAGAAQPIYVDQNATGANDGSSWADAYTSLTSGLNAATASRLDVRVADGTYRPSAGTDRFAVFSLNDSGLLVRGGYAGAGASDPDERDPATFVTVLSGDIGTSGVSADNSYHVLRVQSPATIDGLVIADGNANGSSFFLQRGGGTYIDANLTAVDCIWRDNASSVAGGAVYSNSPTANKRFISCSFLDNATGFGGGGAIGGESDRLLCVNSVFAGNSATTRGGAINIVIANPAAPVPLIVNSTFTANATTAAGGGAIGTNNSIGAATLANTILWANTASGAGETAQIDFTAATSGGATVSTSLIQDLSSFTGGGNIDGDPAFVDAGNGDYRLQSTSPAIDAGSDAALPADLADLDGDLDTAEPTPLDRDGNPRVQCSAVDMGAYESGAGGGALAITCPADTAVACGDSTDPADTGFASASDACAPEAPAVSFADDFTATCGAAGTITRTWTAVSGSDTATCIQTIDVVDATAPVVTAPADVAVACGDSTDPADTGFASAADACDATPAVSFADSTAAGACPGELVITRTWTATDACGNAASADQVITVSDTTAPALTLPADIAIDCNASTDPGDTGGSASAVDACDPGPVVTYSDSVAAGACAGESIVTRTWTATDACGNAASADQIITLTDSTAPVLAVDTSGLSLDPNALPTLTLTDSDCSGAEGATLPGATASDDCDAAPTVSNDAPAAFPAGQTTVVTYTATDGCGNTSSSQIAVDVTYGASLRVNAREWVIGLGRRPTFQNLPLDNQEILIYDFSPGSCADQEAGLFLTFLDYPDIYANCPTFATGVTDADGKVTIDVPPGEWLVLAPIDTDDDNQLDGFIANHVHNLHCGQSKPVYLRTLRTVLSRRPARICRFTGSELLVVEPEYVIWDDVEQPYPFMLEALGDWDVTVSVAPPDGFVPDVPELSESVFDEDAALQFTITEIGSELVPTQTRFDIRHNGADIIYESEIGLQLTPDYARARGFNLRQLRKQGLLREPGYVLPARYGEAVQPEFEGAGGVIRATPTRP